MRHFARSVAWCTIGTMNPKTEKDWTKVFKGLANENRLKIIKMLFSGKPMTVSETKRKLGISYKWTSKNLVDLEKIGILQSKGLRGGVIYFLHPEIPEDIRHIIKIFIK